MSSQDLEKNKRLEAAGWLQLLAIMILFPILFFVCAFFPIWIDVATPY
jgi:hypothetical protein